MRNRINAVPLLTSRTELPAHFIRQRLAFTWISFHLLASPTSHTLTAHAKSQSIIKDYYVFVYAAIAAATATATFAMRMLQMKK